ncbi:MAG TPA: hypothetical protein VIG41_10745, partial [Micrococcaceae bacterium]
GIVLLGVSEARLTRRRLADYIATGWVTAAEVTMLATARGRHQAIAWARPFGGTRTMKSLIRLATRLAFTRQRILAFPAPGQLMKDEGDLLRQITEVRETLLLQRNGPVATVRPPRRQFNP